MLTGDQRRLLVGLFVVAWGTNVSTPLILVYQERLGLTDSGAVGIFCVYVAGIMLALLFAGRLSDRFGRRPLVLPATVLSAVGSLVMLAGRDSFALLLAGRFLLGAVSGATLSVGSAWINELGSGGDADADGSENAPTTRLRVATVTTFVLYIGFGFGPITSALYEQLLPGALVVPYLAHAAACLGAAVTMWRVAETQSGDERVSLRPRLGIPPAARSEFVRVLAPASVWVFGFPSVSFALFPVILREAIGGADVLVAGTIGMLTATSVIFSRPLVGRIGDARRAIPVAMAMGAVGYTIGTVAFASGWWWSAPFAAMALGTASGMLMTSGLAITDEIADGTNRGELSSTFYLAAYSGMVMPLAITALSTFTSTTVALGTVTSVAVLSTVVVLGSGRVVGSQPAEVG